MSKLGLALKVLRNPYARRVIASPKARGMVVKALKNDRVRKTVIKQVSKRMGAR